MAERRSGNEAVASGDDAGHLLRSRRNFTPNMACFKIDGKKAVLVGVLQRLQPSLQGTFSFAFLEQTDAFGDLPNRKNAHKKIPVIGGFHRAPDCGVTLGPPQFRENARSSKILTVLRPASMNDRGL